MVGEHTVCVCKSVGVKLYILNIVCISTTSNSMDIVADLWFASPKVAHEGRGNHRVWLFVYKQLGRAY